MCSGVVQENCGALLALFVRGTERLRHKIISVIEYATNLMIAIKKGTIE